MSTTRIFRFSLAMIAGVAVVLVALVIFVQAKYEQAHPIDGDRLVKALAQYARDVRSRGEPLPPTVSLDTLIQEGYLRTEDAKAFEGAKVIFHNDASETSPQSILVEAHMPDGQVILALGDGSVQGWSRSRFEEALKNAGQPSAATGASQPIGLGTNRTSPEAGPAR